MPPVQEHLVVKPVESENALPYDSQLFFFSGIGVLLSFTKDKRLQKDTLMVNLTGSTLLFFARSYSFLG